MLPDQVGIGAVSVRVLSSGAGSRGRRFYEMRYLSGLCDSIDGQARD
jgi:hypothetical protein